MIAGLGICCMMRPALKPEMVCGTFPRRLVYFDSLVVLPCLVGIRGVSGRRPLNYVREAIARDLFFSSLFSNN